MFPFPLPMNKAYALNPGFPMQPRKYSFRIFYYAQIQCILRPQLQNQCLPLLRQFLHPSLDSLAPYECIPIRVRLNLCPVHEQVRIFDLSVFF